MTNEQLIIQLKSKVAAEKSLTLEVIRLLSELDRRKYYLDLGFSSLFDFATRELGYENSAAYRRISAARLIQEIPEVEDKVESGDLNLSNLAQANQYFKAAKSTKKEKVEVLHQIEGKSYRQTEKILADLSPELPVKEKQRELGNNKIELKIVITEELNQKLEELKSQLSHINPSMNYAELLEILANKVLKKPVPKKSVPAPKVTKTIPAEIKRQVHDRDKGQCSYPGCTSKHLLQYDHIKPQAQGGEHTVENLRLLCFHHHQLITEKIFGKRRKFTDERAR